MIEIKGLSRHYKTKAGTVKALDNLTLELESTGMVFILGKSGSGKSTLLNVLGGLDKYDSGEIIVKGKSSKDFSASDFDSYRNTFVGFIFQDYNVLDEFSVSKNIGLALELQGKKATHQAINDIVKQVDLEGYGNRKPSTLSGGQKQRVAIARALIKEPEIIMADEPTGALDSNTGKQVFETLKKLSKTKLVLVVSHDRENAEHYGDRIIELMDGKVVSDVKKYLAPPQKGSGGISIVDNKIVTIKAGHPISADDAKMLNQFLTNAKADIIISTDGVTNEKLKKFARIDSSGNKESFLDTNRRQLDIRQYDPKQFNLIRSKLPWKDSFKIGASGLKVKPIRLVFTILLCVVAFTLFGLADTMASYNRIQATISSIEQGNIDFATFSKDEYVTYQDSEEGYWTGKRLRETDISKLNNDLDGVNFHPVYSFGGSRWDNSINFSQNIHTASDLGSGAYGSFYKSSFSGAVEISDAERQNLSFSLSAGRMPQANDEIAVTKYVFDHFKLGGYKENAQASSTTSNKVSITSEGALINKTLTLDVQGAQRKFKIVGVVDTHLDESRYEVFKNQSSGTIFDYMLVMEFDSLLRYSYHSMLFTNIGLYQEIKQSQKFLTFEFQPAVYFQTAKPSEDNVNWENMTNIQKMGKLSDLDAEKIVWKDGQPKTYLSKNEVILNISAYNHKQTTVNEVNEYIYFSLDNVYNAIVGQLYNQQPSSFDVLYATNTVFAELFPNKEFYASYVLGDQTGDNYFSLKNRYEDFEWKNQEEGKLSTEEQSFLTRYPTFQSYLSAFESIGGASGFDVNHFDADFVGSDFFDLCVKTQTDMIFADDQLTSMYLQYYLGDIYKSLEDSEKYDIVGVYFGEMDSSLLVFDDNFYAEMEYMMGGDFAFAISKMPTNANQVRAIVEFDYLEQEGVRFLLQNQVTYSLQNINNLIETLADVFLYVGIGFAVFASLMMLNFITTSISHKKREIGILRAVGATGKDVFGIFFNESMLITLINFVIALIGTIVVCTVLNITLREQVGLMITLLHFGVRQVALMLAISIFVAFVSSFLPVNKISRMRPIDAIKKG